MARAYECDRCKGVHLGERTLGVDVFYNQENDNRYPHDLCDCCSDSFQEWLKKPLESRKK